VVDDTDVRNLEERHASLTPAQRALLTRTLRQRQRRLPWEEHDSGEGDGPVPARPAATPRRARRETSTMDFSLFFFSGDGSVQGAGKYDLLLDCARFADRHGFAGIWVPERHFVDFGGLYPNPSVLAAALAVVTERIQIRAGSVVVPLHHPVRLAEEWSVVDNLSGGRVAVSAASGWHPDDFILAPDQSPERHERRREELFDILDVVHRLWAGERVPMRRADGEMIEVRTLPRPLQPRLPVWISSQGTVETFVRAGAAGANVLTGLMAQRVSDLGEKISAYRTARRDHGHDPSTGRVAGMAHTFLGPSDEGVRRLTRGPLIEYLKTFLSQQDAFGGGYAEMNAQERDVMLSATFDRYFDTIALLGTPDKCETLIEDLVDVGLDEVACLVDFGVEASAVLEGLTYLNDLKDRYGRPEGAEG
jgi:natural product biosynthesis luciferase-like monooxygenase protein